MPKISVIMPCLNMVSYIENCIESVISQTLSNIEILVIDAGSTDGTLDILQTYADKDSRIKIIHSQRKSYGYQVNLGIDVAMGEYIGIVDTDDYIVRDMYETLYHLAVETGADYVKGTAKMFYTLPDKNVYCYPLQQFSQEEYGEQGIIEVCPKRMPQLLTMDNFLWSGIYRNEFFKKIKLNESPGAAFQDLGGLLQTQINAEKAVYISKPVYQYRQDNVTASTHNNKGFQFIENEYAWAERFLEGQSKEWHVSFYRKQFLHLMDRVYAMATSEFPWDNSLSSMLTIAKRLSCANGRGILTEKDLTQEQWLDLQILWKSPYFLYEKYRKFYEAQKASLQQVIRFSNSKKQIIIFGSGRLGRFIHAQLLYRKCKRAVAYCDNNENAHGKQQYDLKILSPEEAVKRFPEAGYIIANKKNADDMQKQLEKMGIGENNIAVYSAGADLRLFGENIN